LLHLLGRQDYTACDSPCAHLFQRIIRLGKRARGHLTLDFAGGRYCEDFFEIVARSYSGGLNADFTGGHHNRRKTDIFSGQAYDEQSSSRPQATERCVIGCPRCGSNNDDMCAAGRAKFLNNIVRRRVQRSNGAKLGRRCKLFLRNVDGGNFRSETSADLNRKMTQTTNSKNG